MLLFLSKPGFITDWTYRGVKWGAAGAERSAADAGLGHPPRREMTPPAKQSADYNSSSASVQTGLILASLVNEGRIPDADYTGFERQGIARRTKEEVSERAPWSITREWSVLHVR